MVHFASKRTHCRAANELLTAARPRVQWWHRPSLGITGMSQKQLCVIVVEDHADTAEGLRRFLNSIGYHVYIAPDVASARALAKAVEYDILLSDLRLPDGTGWELMEELSAKGHVPAIAMSGYNSEDDVSEACRLASFITSRNRSRPRHSPRRSITPRRRRKDCRPRLRKGPRKIR
jgi:CheY-like chemotaxis protein